MNVCYDKQKKRWRHPRSRWKRTRQTPWPCKESQTLCSRRRPAVRCKRPFRCPLPSCHSWHSAATWSAWSRRTCGDLRSCMTASQRRTRSRPWWSTGTNGRVYYSDRLVPQPRSASVGASGAGGSRKPRRSVLRSVFFLYCLFLFKKKNNNNNNDWLKRNIIVLNTILSLYYNMNINKLLI